MCEVPAPGPGNQIQQDSALSLSRLLFLIKQYGIIMHNLVV